MKKQLPEVLIYGAGGHGKVVADVIERQKKYNIAGFLDDNGEIAGKEILGYRVLGSIDIIINENLSGYNVIIAIGSNQAREQLVIKLYRYSCNFIEAIHPSAQISRDTLVGSGVMIMANAAINPGSTIGNHSIINTGVNIDHDCIIGNFVHISPAVTLAGNVTVNDGVHLGMGCCILPGISIGENSVIGAGAVVTRDIPAGVTAFGVPAKIKTNLL